MARGGSNPSIGNRYKPGFFPKPGFGITSKDMSNQPLPQPRLFTVRQVVAAISILVGVVFAVSYSSRIVVGMKTQDELRAWQQRVAEERDRNGEILKRLREVNDPAVIDAVIRNELNWIKPGDQPVVPVVKATMPNSAPLTAPASQVERAKTEASNWQRWWQLLAPPP